MYTRESLELIDKEQGFQQGLRPIGESFGLKSTSSSSMISKILTAQNDIPEPNLMVTSVEFLFMDDLTDRKRNAEIPYGDDGAFFPALVPDSALEKLSEALQSFSHQWNFSKVEFFSKFQAFRLYKDGRHVDWIGLNEVSRRYQLKIPVAARTAARRLYTAPTKRAYT